MRYPTKQSKAGADGSPKPTNPIWRGIGCILFLITPILSFLIANEVMKAGVVQQYIAIPRAMRNSFYLEFFDITFPFFNATLVLTAGVTIGLFAVFFAIYALIYKVIGPSPYGPFDVPPLRSKRRVRKSR